MSAVPPGGHRLPAQPSAGRSWRPEAQSVFGFLLRRHLHHRRPSPPTLGGDATLQDKRQLHPTKYRPPRGRVYQASVVIPLSLRDPRDARRARVQPFTMDLLKAACYARRSGFVPTRALSGTFSRPGDGASGTRRGTLMEYPQGHRGACTRTVPKPVACCLNCRFVESFTRQRSCRPPQAA